MSGLRPKALLIWSRLRSHLIIFQSVRMFSLAEPVLKHLFHWDATVCGCFAILFMNQSLNCCESSHGSHKVLTGDPNWWRKLETFQSFYMTKILAKHQMCCKPMTNPLQTHLNSVSVSRTMRRIYTKNSYE